MENTPSVLDVTEETFAREVEARSSELPVVVDFWAPWCGPCRTLGPILERLVDGEFKGELVLAKVNTDENPELSARFRIQGIPAVLIFRDGKVAAEFVGAYPESEVRRVFASVLPSEADLLALEGKKLAESGDAAGAEARFRETLEKDRLQPGALLGLGKLLEDRGAAEEALGLYARVPGSTPEEPEAARRAAAIGLRAEANAIGTEAELRARLAKDPRDVEALYGLGLNLAARGEHREALERLLEAVTVDRKFRDDAARRAMLAVFEAIGRRTELADEFRTRLASALY